MHDPERSSLSNPARGGPFRSSTELMRAEPLTHGRYAPRTSDLWPEHEQVLKLDLRRLLDVLWGRKRLFVCTCAIIIAVAALVILSSVPQYDAVSSVVIAPEEPIVEVRAMMEPMSTETQAITSQIEIIRSRSLVERVIEKTGFRAHLAAPPPPSRLERLLGLSSGTVHKMREWLTEAVAFDSRETSQSAARDELPHDKVLIAFYTGLDVWRVPNTSIIAIAFRATDPVLAANAANQLAEEYLASQIKAKQAARTDAIKLLTERRYELRKQVDESDQAVERFRTEAGLVKSASTELVNQQLSNQMTELAAARAQALTLHGRLAELHGLRARAAGDELLDLLASPSILLLQGEVLQLQREIASQSQEFGPKHPVITKLDADLREAISRLRAQVNNAIQAVHSEASMATERVRELELTIAALKGEMAKLNAKEYTLRRLEAEAQINRSLHDAIVNRMREAEDGVFERADARILDVAEVPTLPASSHTKIFLALALVGAFCFSSGVALGLEFLSGAFRTEEELAGSLGIPVLAAVPRAFGKSRLSLDVSARWMTRTGSACAEAFHSLLTGLELVGLGAPNGRAAVVLVTSAVPHEGKSTVTSGLARLAAKMGSRVLVIDCDLRRPRMHSLFGIDNHRGLSTCELDESNRSSSKDLIRIDRSSRVHVIPAGPNDGNPQRHLRGPLLPRIIAANRHDYDFILIDTSPVLAVADPLVIGQLCDGAVVVVKWSSTARRLVQRAMARLSLGGVAVIGGVLNQVAPSAHKAQTYSHSYLTYS
jgi:succinoglycan biosynthesis transport protein ExoP